MKIKILRDTVVNLQHVEKGEVIDLPDNNEAEFLIRIKKAARHIPLKKRRSKVKKNV